LIYIVKQPVLALEEAASSFLDEVQASAETRRISVALLNKLRQMPSTRKMNRSSKQERKTRQAREKEQPEKERVQKEMKEAKKREKERKNQEIKGE
jgi:hypothetical protein